MVTMGLSKVQKNKKQTLNSSLHVYDCDYVKSTNNQHKLKPSQVQVLVPRLRPTKSERFNNHLFVIIAHKTTPATATGSHKPH